MNPFVVQAKPNKVVKDYVQNDDDSFIYEYKEIEKLNPGSTEYDFKINKEVVVASKVKRSDFVNSFKDDVGVLNILKKVALTGDMSLINVNKHPTGELLIDVDDSVDNIDAMTKYDGAQKAFDSIPVELRGNMTIEQFLSKFKSEDIINYLTDKATKEKEAAAAAAANQGGNQ